jgi:hypothetical protein
MSLTRDALIAFKPKTVEVSLPDNGSVYVRELKASEVFEFSKLQSTDFPLAINKVVLWGTVDESGAQVFTDPKDLGNVAALPYQVSQLIYLAVLEVSGLNHDEAKKKHAE